MSESKSFSKSLEHGPAINVEVALVVIVDVLVLVVVVIVDVLVLVELVFVDVLVLVVVVFLDVLVLVVPVIVDVGEELRYAFMCPIACAKSG